MIFGEPANYNSFDSAAVCACVRTVRHCDPSQWVDEVMGKNKRRLNLERGKNFFGFNCRSDPSRSDTMVFNGRTKGWAEGSEEASIQPDASDVYRYAK